MHDSAEVRFLMIDKTQLQQLRYKLAEAHQTIELGLKDNDIQVD